MTNSPNWAATSAPGTVLMFHFPNAETGGPGKARPCLVIAASDDCGGRRLTIAYGTTAATNANRGLELEISSDTDRVAAGLHHNSRFVLSRRITVAASDRRFATRRDGNPVLGALRDRQRSHLAALVDTLGPTASTDCLRGLPRQRSSGTDERRHVAIGSRRRIDPRVVVVEHRRRRRRFPSPSPSAA